MGSFNPRGLHFLCGLGLVALLGACSSSSRDGAPGTADSPRIVSANLIDVDLNGVDELDVMTLRFDRPVVLVDEELVAILPESITETFGEGAVHLQSVPGSDTLEVFLGRGPRLVPGTSDTAGVTKVNVFRGTGRVANVESTNGRRAAQAKRSIVLEDATALAPVLAVVQYVDADSDGILEEGDLLIASFDKPILVPDGSLVEDNFALPVGGDSFGAGAKLKAGSSLEGNRAVRIELGAGAVLAGSPSQLEVVEDAEITDTVVGSPLPLAAGVVADIGETAVTFYGPGREADQILSNASAIGAVQMDQPSDVLLIRGKLIVSDTGNHRVLIYDTFPLDDDPEPDVILGQQDSLSILPNRGGSPSASTLNLPTGLATDGTALVVADTGNHRVLIWSPLPVATGEPADIVLGQETESGGFRNAGGGVAANTFWSPVGLHVADDTLAVADRDNNRVLLFNDFSGLAGFDDADVAVGQSGFDRNQPNRGEPMSQETLNGPEDLLIAGGRLYVADTLNHRVLTWKPVPRSSGRSADTVYGQSDFYTAVPNAPGGNTLLEPAGLAIDADLSHLWVADSGNNRVVVYGDVKGSPQGAQARVSLGQPTLFRGEENQGQEVPGLGTLFSPRGVIYNGYELIVADLGNNRLVVYR